MGLKRTVDPAAEPITTAEAKTHARVSTSADDSYIDSLIKAAREQVEAYTGRALINQTWQLTLDAFPCDRFLGLSLAQSGIEIPINPLGSVSSIQYVDWDGNTQTWASGNYTVDATKEIARIVPGYQVTYPVTRSVINAVTVTFVAGYGATAASVPESFKLAIKMMVAHWYDNRAEMGLLPQAAERLLGPYTLMVNL